MNYFPKLLLTFGFSIFDFLLVSCAGSNCAQNKTTIPPDIFKKANEFVISKTGEEFFNKYITPDFSLSRELESGYLVVYSISIKEKPFVKGTISFALDSTGNINTNKEIAGIPDCIKSPGDCEFNIDIAATENIARQNGLEKGVKQWDVKFLWSAQFNKYVWYVINTLAESEGGYGSRANGKEFIIDPNSGVVLFINEWRVN